MKKRPLFILLAIVMLCACNQEEISSLRAKIDFKNNQISTYKGDISQVDSYLVSLNNQKETLRSQCQFIHDSIGRFIREYPFATAYIYRFDRENPIDIIQDYLDASNDDERSKILLGDLILVLYYGLGHNIDTVYLARKTLRGFDQRSQSALEDLKSLREEIDDCILRKEKINSSIAILQQDIKSLNDSLNQYEQ
jgi:septal ring factor EnvC (AmiA/AmiB activator)